MDKVWAVGPMHLATLQATVGYSDKFLIYTGKWPGFCATLWALSETKYHNFFMIVPLVTSQFSYNVADDEASVT